jgi:hypothetical protein
VSYTFLPVEREQAYLLPPSIPGQGLPSVQVEWVSPPHCFRAGRIMAVYLGSSPRALAWLQGLFGEQFAGA